MFGYVLPRKDKLSESAAARYRAGYCGLCRNLKLRYGIRGRFLVNYDMTFLYFLLEEGMPKPPIRCFCPARPFCKKACLPQDPELDFAADVSVLLSFWKLRDAERDGRFFRKQAARLAMAFYRRCYQKAEARLPQLNELFGIQLAKLQTLEAAECASIDRTADAFALLLRQCAVHLTDEAQRRTVELLLYHVGRFLYLADALEDLPKDNRSGSYNPLCYRYSLCDGTLCEQDKQQLLDTMDASLSLAASALELLPPKADREILTNIIYYGLPAVLRSVANGTFRKRRRK